MANYSSYLELIALCFFSNLHVYFVPKPFFLFVLLLLNSVSRTLFVWIYLKLPFFHSNFVVMVLIFCHTDFCLIVFFWDRLPRLTLNSGPPCLPPVLTLESSCIIHCACVCSFLCVAGHSCLLFLTHGCWFFCWVIYLSFWLLGVIRMTWILIHSQLCITNNFCYIMVCCHFLCWLY